MASEAEIDLVVNASQALGQVTRDLNQIVTTAENGAPDIDLNAALNAQASLLSVQNDLDDLIQNADPDSIDLDAVLDQLHTLNQLDSDLDDVIRAAQAGAAQDPIQLQGVLDGSRTLVGVRSELDAVITTIQRVTPPITLRGEVDWDRDALRSSARSIRDDLTRVLRTAGDASRGAASALLPVGVGIAGIGAAAGTAAPLVAGLVGAVESIIPAAAVATTGLLAIQLATNTVRLGMLGVSEAVELAFDPEAKPEDLAKAMENLAPNARDFVTQLQEMKGEFKDLQLGVQDRLFKGLDDTLVGLSRSALPQVQGALNRTAVTLNTMARGVGDAAMELAENGTLGRALKGATTGLNNLVELPAQATTAFGQLAAAAAPSFDRITKALAKAAEGWSKDLTEAFDSGALEKRIDQAVDALAQLGRVGANVFGIIGNVADAASQEGQGLFGTLEMITGALRDVTGSEAFQTLIGELVATMATAGREAFPIFTTALSIVSQVMAQLAPIARELLRVLGPTLVQILDATEEPILALSEALGIAVEALLPLIELAGELIAGALPALTPLFETLGRVITEMTPVIEELAKNIGIQLTPFLEALPVILEEILPLFETLAAEVFPVLAEMLVELSPYLADLSLELADLAVQLAPVIADFLSFSTILLGKIIPVIGPLLTGLIVTLTLVLRLLAMAMEEFVLPALRTVGNVLSGDFSGALESAGVDAGAMKNAVTSAFNQMAGNAIGSVVQMAVGIGREAARAGVALLRGVNDGINKVKTLLSNLPSIARGILSGLGSVLFSAGAALIGGLISGISSKIGEVRSKLSELTGLIPDWKGPMEKDKTLLTENGKAIMDSLMDGFDARLPEIRSQLGAITATIPQSVGQVRPAMSPVVFVTIGNEAVDQYVTTRVRRENDAEARVLAQGVRR